MTLLEQLMAARDDDERRALLAASPEQLEQLNAELYRQYMAESEAAVDAEQAGFREFERELADAPDDATRTAVIRARKPEFLAAWTYQRTSTPTDWCRRYQNLVQDKASQPL